MSVSEPQWSDGSEVTPPARNRRFGPALLAMAAAIGLLIGGLTGFWLRGGESAPSNLSADAGFARDMSTHHAQAVELSFLIRDRSQNEDLRRMAFDIITSQQQQIGQMSAWLTLWGLPQTGTEPAMAWMGSMPGMDHGSMSPAEAAAAMPGLASPADVARLTAATGTEAESLFLTLMIAHHKGGAEMAKAALELAQRPEVRSLAQSMVNAQTAEITTMEQMLRTLG